MDIKSFFNKNYASSTHYWWKGDNRFSTDEQEHNEYYRTIIAEARMNQNGCALDLGAGEGADAIRLAKIGLNVDAVEISENGVDKISKFAAQEGVSIHTTCADITEYTYTKQYDIIMCNGVLHYVNDKKSVIIEMQKHTKIGGVNCISLFSTFSPVPECHKVVPVFPEEEGGIVEQLYGDWEILFRAYDHNKPESSHDDMPPHKHSFIKIICRMVS